MLACLQRLPVIKVCQSTHVSLQAVLPRKAGAVAESMDIDEEGGGAAGSAEPAAAGAAAAATLSSLDFSSLKPKQLAAKDKEAVEADFG